MSHEASLFLSVVFVVLYAGLFSQQLRGRDGLGRTFLLGTFLALAIFWTFRAVAYGILVDHGNVSVVNELLRYSAYAVALPGIWVIAMEWRDRR